MCDFVNLLQNSDTLSEFCRGWNINKLIAKLGDDDEAILYYAEQTIAKNGIET